MKSENKQIKIPKNVLFCINTLKEKGFTAYIVGGCTRDYLRGKEPSDWDVTTAATPEQTQTIFNNLKIKTFYENTFGTVGVAFKTKKKEPEYEIVEITTYRSESSYSDNRHPDKVEWSKSIEEDLLRRDFTINAIALSPINSTQKFETIDLFSGQEDLKKHLIKAVGIPEERFKEDALRMMRAIRFQTTLGENWEIEEKTWKAIVACASLLKNISQERIRDELIKIINHKNAAKGIELLRISGLLAYIIPELLEGCDIAQNKHHVYDCYKHNLESLDFAAKKGFNFQIKTAALLHDIGKPRTKRGTGINATFYNHEIVGAKMTTSILKRLHFTNKDAEKITILVRYHLFYYNVDEVKEASIRRLIKNVGIENMEDLLKLRMADRIGSGCPKAEPYKLRHLKYMIDKVSTDPISVKMLKINGQDIMDILKIQPSPKIGQILDVLLEEVLKDPKNNTKKYLKNKLKELSILDETQLKELSNEAKEQKNIIQAQETKKIKGKYWVC
ncbi:MAG: HD domain-containing protein [Candidatus Paceibacterota bacterium]|jgi:poly(A) polymerase/tRNA nucleotidyltransferase (CCA-adding enzyme)